MRKNILGCIATGLLLLAAACAYTEQQPAFSATGPDAAEYGAAEHYPVGSLDTLSGQKYLVGDFSHFDRLFPARTVASAPQVWHFSRPPNASRDHIFSRRQPLFAAGLSKALADYRSIDRQRRSDPI
ncbi:MAG TPA: hypothetical protein VHZ07_00100 [Bryobacteraceae bacterium]|jgi:hypothetical protein|nr:hypothetical protein [Bryobacteraceae bacterium]